MPREAYFVLIPCLTLVVLYALWKGRGLVIGKSSIEVKGAEKQASVRVGRGLVIEGSKVGDIAGTISTGGAKAAAASGAADVEVLDGARIKGSNVGDVTGSKQGGEGRGG